MVDLQNIIPKLGRGRKIPIHIAINATGTKKWASEKNKEIPFAAARNFEIIDQIFDLQVENESRVLSIALENEPEVLDELKKYLKKILADEKIIKNQVRIFIIGQWYESDFELRELFKDAMERTRHFDGFFLNFLIRYDGQEELLGAVRILNRKILGNKLKEEDLTISMIKENLYNSYFPPPTLIIETAAGYSGTLLWDSKGSVIYYLEKPWLSFEPKDYDDAIAFYNRIAFKD